MNAAYSASDNCSATVATGIPVRQAQAPARSQLPLCGRATTAPVPAYAVRSTDSFTVTTRPRISAAGQPGSASCSKMFRRCEATAVRSS